MSDKKESSLHAPKNDKNLFGRRSFIGKTVAGIGSIALMGGCKPKESL